VSLESEMRTRLASLDPVSLELVDESAQHAGHSGARPGGNTHWKLKLVSMKFCGLSSVARHRLVYQALEGLMHNPIHALAITASTPDETKGSK
jgi:BolA protein